LEGAIILKQYHFWISKFWMKFSRETTFITINTISLIVPSLARPG
jgi:hypothetical protein